ncbi:MAG: hypothetical protein CMO07_11715 [Thalassospira sp.]|uniref:hypothetical protein n=1 Tax=unclassified Thalassospira TaxID=2648997 RepID=UPI000C4DB261|nr:MULTISPECIES: hypothetical protein [unclassified Thalassospira]MBE71365.1 hypothetical protein [Thalassospira sp.]QPO11726.1 hypothetical protein IT893_18850 [Thalassospira sp. A40-3]|tara:strand:+ start:259 stop:939 length:681 start_codon:yes stop_codon:yes gene_type:complete
MPKRAREDLLEALEEQIDFLRRSSAIFDTGYKSEAKRLANHVMILLHDSKKSFSLLSQLGVKNQFKFIDTGALSDSVLELIRADLKARGIDPNTKMYHQSARLLCLAKNHPKPTLYEPLYDSSLKDSKWLSFNEWWHQDVILDHDDRNLSRNKLTAYLRDKDGGAHIDPKLGGNYHRLTRGKAQNMKLSVGGKLLFDEGPILPTMRQIAFELLHSITQQLESIKRV